MAAPGPSSGEYDFTLDDFQVRAIRALDEGRSVLVAAPTGSGSTWPSASPSFALISASRAIFRRASQSAHMAASYA